MSDKKPEDRRPVTAACSFKAVHNVEAQGFNTLHPKGLYWLETLSDPEGKPASALVTFFRPTGITYGERPSNIKDMWPIGAAARHQYRFSLETKRLGIGAGGVEVRAHRIGKTKEPVSRMALLVETSWATLRVGTEIGDVGWFPRELSPLYRKLFYDHPYAITHYSLKPNPKTMGHPLDIPNLMLCLIIWRMQEEWRNHFEDALITQFDTVADRTNLAHWDKAEYQEAMVIPAEFDGDLIPD